MSLADSVFPKSINKTKIVPSERLLVVNHESGFVGEGNALHIESLIEKFLALIDNPELDQVERF